MFSSLMQHKLLAGFAIVVIAAGAWYGISGGGQVSSDSLLTSDVIPVSGPDQELIETLLALRAVQLDGIIFSQPTFQVLRDYSTAIVPEPVGRPNPFAPLGAGATASASSTQGAQIFTPGKSGATSPQR